MQPVMELPPLGLYTFNVTSPTEWKLFPWKQNVDTMSNDIKKINGIFKLNVSVENYLQTKWSYSDLKTTVRAYEHMLFYSIKICL